MGISVAKGNKAEKPAFGKLASRNIPPGVQNMLWGKAAGRCQFAGCNDPLWKSPVTQETVNLGEHAHIYGFGNDGPRARKSNREKIHSFENLILVCDICHKKIDKIRTPDRELRYTAEHVEAMKRQHEARVERACSIAQEMVSEILLFGANIGVQGSPLNFAAAAEAIFPTRYPASDRPIELSLVNSSFCDKDADFWSIEEKNLRNHFERRVRDQVRSNAVKHLSIFSLAPQPLLILLGSLLGDITEVDVYQRQREPKPTWTWPDDGVGQEFVVPQPRGTGATPALVLAISATVTDDRIHSVCADATIWSITVPKPHNDVLKTRSQLGEFRQIVRTELDRIKARHGQRTPIHIFPAVPNSVAIELGRVRMPKADAPWSIYDQNNDLGGFIQVLALIS